MSRTHRRLKKEKRNPLPIILLVILLILVCAYVGLRLFLQPPDAIEQEVPTAQQTDVSPTTHDSETTEPDETVQSDHYQRKEKFYTILCSGVDDGNGGSDTNILLAVDAKTGYMYGVSIPRDTKAIINGKAHKINAAYNTGGMELLADTVSDQLGIPVDYTILVNLKGFAALVDAIGGVDFYVPVNMDYDDPYQDLSIHFSKGQQHLTGAQALKVVRFRHNNDGSGYGSEDVGRMETQQKFLKTVAKQLLTASTLTRIDDLVSIFHQHVDTHLSLGNLAWLGTEAVRIGADNIAFSTLPSEWKSPYMHLQQDELLEVINTYLNPYTEDRTADDLNLP